MSKYEQQADFGAASGADEAEREKRDIIRITATELGERSGPLYEDLAARVQTEWNKDANGKFASLFAAAQLYRDVRDAYEGIGGRGVDELERVFNIQRGGR